VYHLKLPLSIILLCPRQWEFLSMLFFQKLRDKQALQCLIFKVELLNRLRCWARRFWSQVISSLLNWSCLPSSCVLSSNTLWFYLSLTLLIWNIIYSQSVLLHETASSRSYMPSSYISWCLYFSKWCTDILVYWNINSANTMFSTINLAVKALYMNSSKH
jgi:hypothetical protein